MKLHNTEEQYSEYDFEGTEVQFSEDDKVRSLSHVSGPWTKSITKFARSKRVNEICITAGAEWKDRSLDFLAEIDTIKSLTLNIPFQWKNHSLGFLQSVIELEELVLTAPPCARWSQVERLRCIRRLRLFYEPADSLPESIDFNKLESLRHCGIEWADSWASCCRSKPLRELEIGQADQRNSSQLIKRLDLSALENLKLLRLVSCRRLESVKLNEGASVSKVYINNCPKLMVEPLLNSKLKQLMIVGYIKTEWSAIGVASNLEELEILGVRKFSTLEFLNQLKHLKAFSTHAKLSPHDSKIVDVIYSRKTK